MNSGIAGSIGRRAEPVRFSRHGRDWRPFGPKEQQGDAAQSAIDRQTENRTHQEENTERPDQYSGASIRHREQDQRNNDAERSNQPDLP